jgi:putative transposase
VPGVPISIKHLLCSCFHLLQNSFLHWTRPLNTSSLLGTLADLARGKSELVAENALLRQQLIMLRRQSKRPVCTWRDRSLLVLLARATRSWRQVLLILQPETLLRWHRQSFRLFWKHKSKATSHKPKVAVETILLIKDMAKNNRLWGAERIRGELLKLDIHVCKRTIQKYMRGVRTPRPRGQSWRTFLHNHGGEIWACDFLQVTDLFFRSVAGLLHHRTAITESGPRRCDEVPHRRLDRATTAGGHSLWTHAEVSHSRS